MNNKWKGIYGQQSVLDILDRLILSSNIPHAFLFTGIDGVGKEFTAIKFTAVVNSIDTSNSQHLDQIISAYSEPYVKFVYPLPRGKNETDESGPFEKLNSDDLDLIKGGPMFDLPIALSY